MIPRSKAKVCKLDGVSIVLDKYVLRLEVSVVNSKRMAVLDGVQDLEESSSRKEIISNKVALLGNLGEEIALGAELKENVGASGSIDNEI